MTSFALPPTSATGRYLDHEATKRALRAAVEQAVAHRRGNR